jgi:hypothetical protein
VVGVLKHKVARQVVQAAAVVFLVVLVLLAHLDKETLAEIMVVHTLVVVVVAQAL